MKATMLRADFGRSRTMGWTLMQVMKEARQRTGLSPRAFAAALNEAAEGYNPGLTAEAIEVIEEGHIPPSADILCHAMWLAGHDTTVALMDWVKKRSRPYPRSPFSPSSPHASEPDPD